MCETFEIEIVKGAVSKEHVHLLLLHYNLILK